MARRAQRRSATPTAKRPCGRPKRQVLRSPAPFPAALLRPTGLLQSRRASEAGESSVSAAAEVLCLPSPDWLAHRLVVSGPTADLTAFQGAASGPGVIPWRQEVADLAEGWFNRMVAMPVHQRGISVAGAHIVADQLCEAVEARRNLALDERRRARACPLDLHVLIPVPPAMLDGGPNDRAIAWLWEHWGTTWALRHVTARPDPAASRRSPEGAGRVRFRFHAADWSPWLALRQIRARWPALRFDLRPDYGSQTESGSASRRRRPDRAPSE